MVLLGSPISEPPAEETPSLIIASIRVHRHRASKCKKNQAQKFLPGPPKECFMKVLSYLKHFQKPFLWGCWYTILYKKTCEVVLASPNHDDDMKSADWELLAPRKMGQAPTHVRSFCLLHLLMSSCRWGKIAIIPHQIPCVGRILWPKSCQSCQAGRQKFKLWKGSTPQLSWPRRLPTDDLHLGKFREWAGDLCVRFFSYESVMSYNL